MLKQISQSCRLRPESHLEQISGSSWHTWLLKLSFSICSYELLSSLTLPFPSHLNMLVHPLQPQVGCFGVLKGGPCGLFHSPHSSSTLLAQGWGWGPWSALGHILHFPSSRLSSSQGWMSLSSGCCQSGYRAKKLQLDLLQIYAALGSIRTPQAEPLPLFSPNTSVVLGYLLCCATITTLYVCLKRKPCITTESFLIYCHR